MNFQKILVPVLGVVLVAAAYSGYGWGGVALVAGGIVMWVLLHFNRMMQAFKRAAGRPIGYVDSAVMLNASLKPGLPLLHVISLTRSLGQQLSPLDQHPEIYRWTDAGESQVTCEFNSGKLVKWKLARPSVEAAAGAAPAPATDP